MINDGKLERVSYVKFSQSFVWHELRRMLIEAAARQAAESGVEHALEFTSSKIDIRQETEGSPSYPVQRWNVSVELVYNQLTREDD